EIRSKGGEALGLAFSLDDVSGIQPLVDRVVEHYGRIDSLINNAMSTSCVPPLEALSDEQIAFAITSNLTNTLLLSKYCRPHLQKSRGNTLNIASAVVNRHILGMPLYAITK